MRDSPGIDGQSRYRPVGVGRTCDFILLGSVSTDGCTSTAGWPTYHGKATRAAHVRCPAAQQAWGRRTSPVCCGLANRTSWRSRSGGRVGEAFGSRRSYSTPPSVLKTAAECFTSRRPSREKRTAFCWDITPMRWYDPQAMSPTSCQETGVASGRRRCSSRLPFPGTCSTAHRPSAWPRSARLRRPWPQGCHGWTPSGSVPLRCAPRGPGFDRFA